MSKGKAQTKAVKKNQADKVARKRPARMRRAQRKETSLPRGQSAMLTGNESLGMSQRAQASVSLQRAMGNARLVGIQARLDVGAANDPCEQEAEDVSRRVMSGRAAFRTDEGAPPAGGPAQAIRTLTRLRPLHRQEDEAGALHRAGEEQSAQPLRRQEEGAATASRQEDAAKALHRAEEEQSAQPLRRQEEGAATASRQEDAAQPLRRSESEQSARPLRRQEEDAGALHRAEEEGSAQPLRRQEESAATASRQEDAAKALHRAGEEQSAQPLRRQEEGAATASRQEDAAQATALRRVTGEEKEEPVQNVRRQGEEAAAEEPGWPEPAEGEVEELESAGVQDMDMETAGEGEVQALRAPEPGPEGGPVSDAGLEARIKNPDGGRPLPESTKSRMESSFSADFSSVRVHDTPRDQADAKSLNARAFARGADIWLGPGESASDPKLMSHELSHVVQQDAAPRRQPEEAARRSPRLIRRFGLDTILNKLAEWAREIPGYHLLTVILGKDPISDKPVERNAINLVRAILSLVPGGNKLFESLQKSGAIERAFKWFSEQIGALNITWAGIKALFKRAWDEVSLIRDGPSGAWKKVKGIFGPTLGRILNFVKAVGKKILEFIFEGAMSLGGPLAVRVVGVIRKAGAAFGLIINDPIGFMKNLLGAVTKGFRQFSGNILTHLKTGLMGWLFGTLSSAGLQMPEKFDLKGILSIALQVLGITYERIRAKLVKVIGEKRVAYMEKAVAFLKIIVTEGVAGVWKKLLEYIGNLKDMVIGAIRNWVVTKIITAAVTKVVSLFNPASALIQAVITIYNIVAWFIERFEQILDLVEAVIDSITNIALGKIGPAANYVEKTMARTLPIIISFLARLVGLGGIAGKIKGIIKKIQAKVDKAIDKVIGFLVKKAKALFKKVKAGVAAGVKKVKSILWPKAKFSAAGEKHEIIVKEVGGTPQTMVASARYLPIKSLLDMIQAKLNEDKDRSAEEKEKCKGKIKNARDAASKLKTAEMKLKAKPGKKNETNVFNAELALAAALKPVFETCTIQIKGKARDKDAIKIAYAEVYKFEGLVGLYDQIGQIPSDKITPDHQPSSKILEIMAAIRDTDRRLLFKDAGVQKIAKDHSKGGVVINLAFVRHIKTRTYGGGGAKAGREFERDAKAEIKNINDPAEDLAKNKNKKRDAVIKLAKKQMEEDVKIVKERITSSINMSPGNPWSDIGKLNGTKAEKEKLAKKVKKQIEGGEKQIERQDFTRMKAGAKDS